MSIVIAFENEIEKALKKYRPSNNESGAAGNLTWRPPDFGSPAIIGADRGAECDL
jgi:hypothetical protein